MKKILIVFLLLSSLFTFSQSKSFEISGILQSKQDDLPIEAATVYLQRVKDSSLVTYTISDDKGKFTLEGKTHDSNVNILVSSIGFKTYQKNLPLNKAQIFLGNILLEENTSNLDAVVLKAKAPPIIIKKDTLEFNVNSFKTKKDANVEDLLKKLPGVEIGEDGKIKINGKEVDKILVNGKPFFSDDPTIATKNLSKEMIEKIQVSNTKTDEEAFTGDDGEKTNKTVNLVVKKENNKGVFGRVSAGYGTGKKHQYAGMYNYFNNDQRISLLAGGNNLNEPGFSYGEINKMFGGSSYNVNRQLNNWGSQGIITSNNSGFNYIDTWGKNLDMSSNYFGSNTNTVNKTKNEIEHILTDNNYFTNSNKTQNKTSKNHSFKNKFTVKLDSTLLIRFTPELNYTSNTNQSNSYNYSFNTINDTINKSTSITTSESTNKTFSNNFNITKRIGQNGSFLKFYMFNKITRNESKSKVDNNLTIYGDTKTDSITKQNRDGDNKTNTFVVETKYRATFFEKKLILNLGIGYRKNTQKNIKNSYDFNEINNDFENFINEDFSSDFQYNNIRITPSIQVSYKKEKWSSSLRGEYLFRTLENLDFLRPDFNLKRKFNAPQITYRLNYKTPKTEVGLRYYLRDQAPQLYQIQPFENISNPSNTIVGNPLLSPTKTHDIRLNLSKDNLQKGISFYTYISSRIQENKIVRKVNVDTLDLTNKTTYANVQGEYSLYGSANINKQIKLDSVKSFHVGVGINYNTNKYINFVNSIQYSSINNSFSPNISARFNWSEVVNLNINYRPSYTQNTFDIDDFEEQEFVRHTLNFRTTNYFYKKFEFSNDINYSYNPNISDGFEKSSWFWNATLGYSLLKDKATLSLKAFDILNQNINARQYAYQNKIVNHESTVLQQYFMLSFSWKFNSLGK